MRFVTAVAVALLLFQATGLPAVLETQECREECPDDDPEGRCPPICPTCTCAAHSHASAVPLGRLAFAATFPPVVVPTAASPPFIPSPDPREILHVPRSPSAC